MAIFHCYVSSPEGNWVTVWSMFHECSMNHDIFHSKKASIIIADLSDTWWKQDLRYMHRSRFRHHEIYPCTDAIIITWCYILKMRWCTRWDQSFHVFLLKFWLSISDNTSTNCWYFPNRKSTRFLGNLFFPRQERISWWTPCATDIRILDVGWNQPWNSWILWFLIFGCV